MSRVTRPTPPDEPILIEVVEYNIDGGIGLDDQQASIRVDVMWRIVQPGTPVTFWMHNLDRIPDVHGVYEWSQANATGPKLITSGT